MTRPPTAPQFPPAVGSLYLSADHLVFQDPVLHNRRVIALSKVTDVRRVPVELQQARMILAHLPGFSLLARGGNLSNISLVNALARLAGFTSAKGRPALQAPTAGEVTPACAKQSGHSPLPSSDDRDGEREVEKFIAALPASPAPAHTVKDARPGREFAPGASQTRSSSEPRGMPAQRSSDAHRGLPSDPAACVNASPTAGLSAGDVAGDVGQADEKGFMGLTALLMRWPGDGIAKFQFVELSGEICTSWIRHVNELVLAHKLARAREDRELDKVPCVCVCVQPTRCHVCVCVRVCVCVCVCLYRRV